MFSGLFSRQEILPVILIHGAETKETIYNMNYGSICSGVEAATLAWKPSGTGFKIRGSLASREAKLEKEVTFDARAAERTEQPPL